MIVVRPIRVFLVACALALAGNASAETFLDVQGSLLLPEGGSETRRVGGATLAVGRYLTDFWALEGRVGAVENGALLGADFLGHWSGWSLYDRYFGYSSFDPFVTLGACGTLGAEKGQVGPCAGLGAFYHLDNHWSIRADARLTLGLDARVETLFEIALGVHYTF